MARAVNWTRKAVQDLEDAEQFIALDSFRQARLFSSRVRKAARSLATFPNRGRVVPDIGLPYIREIFVGRYRLIYQVMPESILILAFVHGARDFVDYLKRGHPRN